MKKIINKDRIIGMFIGVVITSIVSVVAYSYNAKDISYTPSDDNWKVNNISDAIDSIKQTGTYKKVCELKSGNALEIGSKYECNPSLDGTTKYYFYVIRVEGDAVKLIMERNITDTVGSVKSMNWNNAMNFFRNGAGKNLGWKVNVELPKAQDIADAVGNTGWNTADKDYTGWFYFDKNGNSYGQTQVANASNLSAYKWLFNYTIGCSEYGCDSSTSLDSNYSYGYWTGDVVALQKDTTARAWLVNRWDSLGYDTVSNTAEYGVRPVITIAKKNIK